MKKTHFAVAYNRLLARARLRHLQLIVALSDQNSIKGASQILGISQPAATQLLADLELLLEVKLFERHSRGVHPTAFCEALIPILRISLHSIELALEAASLADGDSIWPIRIGCIPAAAATTVANGLAHAFRSNPDFEVSIKEGSMDQLLPELIAGRLDAVCGRRPPPGTNGLRFYPVASDEPLALVCRLHPFAGRLIQSPLELLRFPWVLFQPDDELELYIERLLFGITVKPRIIRLSTSSVNVLFSALHGTNRVCFFPSSLSSVFEPLDWFKRIDFSHRPSQPVGFGQLGWTLRNDIRESPLINFLPFIYEDNHDA